MATFRCTVLILIFIILPSETIAQTPATAEQPSTTVDYDDLDVQAAVTGLIIHSDLKTDYAEKIFETVLPKLCMACDAKPAYVAMLMISMHKAVKAAGVDKKFIPAVMNYSRIVGTVDRMYAERGLAIEKRTEFCSTLVSKYITVRPETETSAAAADDIIEAYKAFLDKKRANP